MKTFFLLCTSLLLGFLAKAQQGTVEYKLLMSQGGSSRITTSTLYFSDGNVRTDISIPLPGSSKPMKQTMLMLKNSPDVTYLLNETSRTYNESKTGSPGAPTPTKATVKVMGKEKIQNLNCTHALVTFDKGTMEIWTTRGIPGYEKLLSYWRSNLGFGDDTFYSELKKSGADGFIVRMKNSGVTMELVRYDASPVAASLFILPKDYKKGVTLDPAALRSMTPAQRQKLMEEFQKQHKP